MFQISEVSKEEESYVIQTIQFNYSREEQLIILDSIETNTKILKRIKNKIKNLIVSV